MSRMSKTVAPPSPVSPASPAPGVRALSPAALPVVLTAVFMAALDFFIVNVSLPSTQRDLHASSAALEWVVAGYGLAYGAGLVTGGRLGDLYGRRRMFAIGLAAFTATSAACGLAPTAGFLVGARVAQGLSAALMSPQVLAMVRGMYTGPAQARAFSRYSMTLGLGAVLGQLIGGALIAWNVLGLGWRACFLINVPVGIAVLLLAPRTLPAAPPERGARLDPVGAVLLTSALTATVLPLVEGREQGWPWWTWTLLGVAAALFVAFAVHQRALASGGGSPLLHPGLFRERAFTAGLGATLLFNAGMPAFFLVFALYVQQGRGMSPLRAGVVFMAIGAGYFVTSLNAHRVSARLGRQTIALGAVLVAAAVVWQFVVIGDIGSGGDIAALVPALVLDGVGMGLVIGPAVSTVLARVTPAHAGSASGALATAQQIGGALGVALVGIVFYGALGTVPGPGAYAHAYRDSLIYLLVTAAAVAVFAQALPGRASRS